MHSESSLISASLHIVLFCEWFLYKNRENLIYNNHLQSDLDVVESIWTWTNFLYLYL